MGISSKLMAAAEHADALCDNLDSGRLGYPCPGLFLAKTMHLSHQQFANRFGVSRRTAIRWRTEELAKIVTDYRATLACGSCSRCRRHSVLLERHARNVQRSEGRAHSGAESSDGPDDSPRCPSDESRVPDTAPRGCSE